MDEVIAQIIVSGLTNGAIYALIGLGFTIVYNATESINFAQGEFVMLGGALASVLIQHVRLPLVLAVAVTVLTVSLVAGLVAWLTIERLPRVDVLTFVIVTLGLSITLKAAARLVFGTDPMSFPPFSGERPYRVLGATMTPQNLWVVAVTAAAMVLLYLFFRFSLTGKAMRAASYNPVGADVVGISVRSMLRLSFMSSALVGALAGVIVAPITFVLYDNGTAFGLKGFAAAVLGGLGNAPGAVVGGVLLGLLEAGAGGLISSHYKDAIAFLVLLVVLCVCPAGILGKRRMLR